MTWLERLRPGSFRGVPFFVDRHEGEGGRRVHLHEFAFRDEGFAEDLGKANPAFSVQAYVVGADYDQTRDRLIDAGNAVGPGTLVHPYYGEVLVACPDMRWRESRAEGRIAHFDFKFVRTTETARLPAATADTAVVLETRAASTVVISKSIFEEVFTLAGLPDVVAIAAESFLSDLAESISDIPVLVDGLDSAATQAFTLAEFAEAVVGLPATVAAGVSSVANAIDNLIGTFLSASTDRVAAESGLAAVVAFAAARAIPGGTGVIANGVRNNEKALVQLVEQRTLAARAENATRRTFNSYDEAAALRDTLTADIGVAAGRAADEGRDTTFLALRALAQAVSADLTTRGATLARVSAYEFGTVVPAAVLAHRLYQNANRSVELAVRNSAVHPLFLPPSGVALSE